MRQCEAGDCWMEDDFQLSRLSNTERHPLLSLSSNLPDECERKIPPTFFIC